MIRAFPAKSLLNAVESAIDTIPPGRHYAVIAHASLDGGKAQASLSAFVRLDTGWSFSGTFRHTTDKGFAGEAALVFSR